MNREAMQMALDALESDPISHAGLVSRKQAITALRQALETEQEPVAWRYKYPDGVWRFSNGERVNGSDPIKSQALYTAPPKAAEWVGLTDDVVFELADTNLYDGGKNYGVLAFAKAIEQALKEKNHG